MSTQNLIQVTPKALRKHSANCIKSKTPFFVWGNPGIGKSRILQSLVESMGYHFEDIRLSQIESVDLRGLPAKEEGPDGVTVVWAMPDFLRRAKEQWEKYKKPTAFFFDELNSGSPATMAAAYQFINDRRIGCFELGAHDVVFAAGNLESDGGVTNAMPLPLANRFRHYIMNVSTEQWLDYASEAGQHPYVLAYLSVQGNSSKLQDFNVDKLMASVEKAYATPRSWEMLSKGLYSIYGEKVNLQNTQYDAEELEALKSLEALDEEESLGDNDIAVVAASCVGSAIAVDFAAFVKEGMNLPKARDILAGKKFDIDIKSKGSAQYFIANDCSHALKEMKDKLSSIKEAKGESSDEYVKFLKDEFMPAMENYILFASDKFARELFVYGVITVMLKRYKVIPRPQHMNPKVFALISTEFKKAKLSN